MSLAKYFAFLCMYFYTFSSYAQQEWKISPGRLRYKIIKEGQGRKAKIGDYVVYRLEYKTDQDSLLFSSNLGLQKTSQGTVPQKQFKGDYRELFSLMSEGDSAIAVMPSNKFFPRIKGINRPKEIASGSEILFSISLLKVTTLEEHKRLQDKKRKLAKVQEKFKLKILTEKHGFEPVDSLHILYREIVQGSGFWASKNKKIKVHYKGFLADGRVFDFSKKPFEFEVGKGQVIAAWEELLPKLKEGSKAVLITPSNKAYGEKGVPGSIVGPYEPLFFEIEVVEVL